MDQKKNHIIYATVFDDDDDDCDSYGWIIYISIQDSSEWSLS